MMDTSDYDKAEYGAFWAQLNSNDADLGEGFFSSIGSIFGSKSVSDCANNPTASPGDNNTNVKELQTLLNEAHAKTTGSAGAVIVEVTGSYDDDTENAVRAFQVKNKLQPSGTTDSATWKKLCQVVYGSSISGEGAAAAAGGVGYMISTLTGKGKKGKGGGGKTPDAPYVAETNWLLWIGVPVVLIAVSGGIYLYANRSS
jgi:peptidoglycan hydrolase-like protein with peptidoglycan-binding domain